MTDDDEDEGYSFESEAEATIYDGLEIVARFDRAEDALACLKSMCYALRRPLRMVNHGSRMVCRIPDGVLCDERWLVARP